MKSGVTPAEIFATYGFDEFGRFAEFTPTQPGLGARSTGVVRGQRGLPAAVELIQNGAQIASAELQVDFRLEQHGGAKTLDTELAAQLFSRRGHHLREPAGAGAADGVSRRRTPRHDGLA